MCFPITTHIEKFSSYSTYLLPCNPWMVINKSSNHHSGLTHFCPFISRHREMVILKFHGFLEILTLHAFSSVIFHVKCLHFLS